MFESMPMSMREKVDYSATMYVDLITNSVMMPHALIG